MYLEPLEPISVPDGTTLVNTFPRFKGADPLHGVFVAIAGPLGWLPNIDYGTMLPNEIGRPRQGAELKFASTDNFVIFHIFINASNGSYSQQIRFKKVDGKWRRASILSKYGSGRTLYNWFESGFPVGQNGRVDWNNP